MSNNIASFQLTDYKFKKLELNFTNDVPTEIDANFITKGIFKQEKSIYELFFNFTAHSLSGLKEKFIDVECVGSFTFQNVNDIKDIPDYFYKNSIAILFPYIRSSISVLTLQANIPALIIPTYNLSNLEQPLRSNTIIE